VSGQVELVEHLGADMLIHFSHGSVTAIARFPHGPPPEVGSIIHFTSPPGQVFIFDPASGARIR
jgi:sn-glycerol 3-phosphate transport system ATP-binding protein/multiple sugar transport system ATP-binding protein